MNTHPLRFAVLAGALLAFGASLSAQGPGPGFGPGSRAGRGLMALNLTEAQQAQVKAIHERHQGALKAKGETASAAHKALREAMANSATDAKTLQALHEKASAAQFDLMLEHRAVRQEILPLLTVEQKAQFEKRGMGSGFGPGAGMMGPRRGHGRGPGLNPDCPMTK
ncbi:Spy/CpxP family protein refolding chaperone [Geothrix fuzhouensis]|uniref:Spy/CpxP family protein refolding chaperone n=1 Tax=Geothrix fuzhouensis TaxID=2966451 RepID=UPI00214862AB|nr:Spy/CpxP family protein refolding chaperone [Geothrix fuzhouensis]